MVYRFRCYFICFNIYLKTYIVLLEMKECICHFQSGRYTFSCPGDDIRPFYLCEICAKYVCAMCANSKKSVSILVLDTPVVVPGFPSYLYLSAKPCVDVFNQQHGLHKQSTGSSGANHSSIIWILSEPVCMTTQPTTDLAQC